MKRAGQLLEQIIDRDNLRLAVSRALRGKRHRPDARAYCQHLESNLQRLAQDLVAGTVAVGCTHQFVIRDPKKRVITAPSFDERVMHHAVMNVCEPVFDRWLIHDTYACRVGKGREAAVGRARQFAGRQPAHLKLDLRKYFDGIPHDELLSRLERLFKDRRLLTLFERIVTAFRPGAGCGLPIGSLMSQHFANFYLGGFDRFATERLRVRGYVRYMDDIVMWAESCGELTATAHDCRQFLADELQLLAKPPIINHSRAGLGFLGCRVFPSHVELGRRAKTRFRRKLTLLQQSFDAGNIGEAELQQRVTSLVAFCRAAGTCSWHVRRAAIEGCR